MGSCRRELLDHVIPLNEQHLRRLIHKYVNYHRDDRTHDSLNKDERTVGKDERTAGKDERVDHQQEGRTS